MNAKKRIAAMKLDAKHAAAVEKLVADATRWALGSTVEQRVAAYLLGAADAKGVLEASIAARHAISEAMLCSRAAVSIALTAFQRYGIVSMIGREITIVDSPRLAEIADGKESVCGGG